MEDPPKGEVHDLPLSRLLDAISRRPAASPLKGADNLIALWDVEGRNRLGAHTLKAAQGFRLAFVNNDSLIALTTLDDTVVSLGVPALAVRAMRSLGSLSQASSLAVVDRSVFVALDCIWVLDAKTLETRRELPIKATWLDASPDGERLAVTLRGAHAIIDLR